MVVIGQEIIESRFEQPFSHGIGCSFGGAYHRILQQNSGNGSLAAAKVGVVAVSSIKLGGLIGGRIHVAIRQRSLDEA